MSLCVESRDSFAFAACCAFLRSLGPSTRTMVHTVDARTPNRRLLKLAAAPTGEAKYRGETVRYALETSDPLPAGDGGRAEPFRRLTLWCSADDADAVLEGLVLDALDAHRAFVQNRVPGHRGTTLAFHWDDGAWDRGLPRRSRPLNSMFLPAGVAEGLLEDLSAFFQKTEAFAALSASPVRVYLVSGPPGSGKSSLVHAVASALGRDVAYFDFGGAADRDLASAFRGVPDGSFLCVEDVDCAFSGRAPRAHGVSFGSFLGALDGLENAEPLAVFLTTNHVDRLDPALRRRADCLVPLGFAKREPARRMFARFFGGETGFDEVWDRAVRKTDGRVAMSALHKYMVSRLGRARADAEDLDALDALLLAAVPGQCAELYC